MLAAAASAQTLALGLGAELSDPPQSYTATLASWDKLLLRVRRLHTHEMALQFGTLLAGTLILQGCEHRDLN